MEWVIKMEIVVKANSRTRLMAYLHQIMSDYEIEGLRDIQILSLEDNKLLLDEYKTQREQMEFLYFEEKAVVKEARAIIRASQRGKDEKAKNQHK